MPKIVRIDLPEGNEVVTTIQHKKIKPPEKKPGPPFGLIIIFGYLAFVVAIILRGQIAADEPLPKPYPIPCPPGQFPSEQFPCSLPQNAQPTASPAPQPDAPGTPDSARQPIAYPSPPVSSDLLYSPGQPIGEP